MANIVATAETVISASPARVWSALTDPAQIKRYMFGSQVETDWILWRMDASARQGLARSPFRRGIVLRVQEATCEIFGEGWLRSVGYATRFPSPRTERVSPGHLVAVATAPDGSEVVAWRWYDAVVLGEENGLTRLWEPAHGEVVAQRRRAQQHQPPGTRAYLSAGLPGADWWVAGAVAARAEDADVELDEVERLYDEHDLWKDLV